MSILAAIGWRVVPRIGIGPLEVSPHGLGIAAGYIAGGSLAARRAERLYGIKRDHYWNALMYAVLGVIVGSRLFFVVGHFDDYWPNVGDVVKIWEGGIVFYGGVFGGIVAAYPYFRRHRIPLLHALDAAAPAFPLGLIFGRIGDLVIGDHLGGPTDLPFGFRYSGGELPGCPAGAPLSIQCPPVGAVLHPTALYDLVNAAVLLPVVLWLGRRRRRDGFLIMFTAAWYGIGRLAVDVGRGGTPTYAGLRGTQWVSVALILAGVFFLVRRPSVRAAAPRDVSGQGSADYDEILADEMVAEGGPVLPEDRPAWHADDSIDPGV